MILILLNWFCIFKMNLFSKSRACSFNHIYFEMTFLYSSFNLLRYFQCIFKFKVNLISLGAALTFSQDLSLVWLTCLSSNFLVTFVPSKGNGNEWILCDPSSKIFFFFYFYSPYLYNSIFVTEIYRIYSSYMCKIEKVIILNVCMNMYNKLVTYICNTLK